MVDFTPFHEVIKERVTTPSAFYYADPWWDAEIKQFTRNIYESILFIKEECSDEELWWLAEIFEDITEVIRSAEFLDSIRERVQRVSNAEWKKDIVDSLRDAAEYLE